MKDKPIPNDITDHITDNILTGRIIRTEKIKYEPICGIYFLYKDNEITYIGSSKDIEKRLSQHKSNGKDFNYYSIIATIPEELKKLAFIYILKHKPVENKILDTSLLANSGFISHEKLKQILKETTNKNSIPFIRKTLREYLKLGDIRFFRFQEKIYYSIEDILNCSKRLIADSGKLTLADILSKPIERLKANRY